MKFILNSVNKLLKKEKKEKDLYFVGSKPYAQMILNSFSNKLNSVSTDVEGTMKLKMNTNGFEFHGRKTENDHDDQINRIQSVSKSEDSEDSGKILCINNSQQQNESLDIMFPGITGEDEKDLQINKNDTENDHVNDHENDNDNNNENDHDNENGIENGIENDHDNDYDDDDNERNRGDDIPSIGSRSEEFVALPALRRKEMQLRTQQTGDKIEQSYLM